MLKLTKKADYGLIALKHLAVKREGSSSAHEIADTYGIPLPLLSKILQKLCKAGFVKSEHGTNGGYRLEEDGSGRVLVQFGDLMKLFHVYLLYARRGFAEQNPDGVRAFLAAWFETIGYMNEHRSETIDIMRRTADVSPFIARRDYDAMIGMFNRTGHFNPEALKVVSRSFVEMGMLPSEPDINALITEKYLPGAK